MEARATKTLDDMRAFPDTLPDKLRLKVFNHQNDWTLIQAEDPGETQPGRFPLFTGYVALKLASNPYELRTFRLRRSMAWRTVSITISGANGREATTAQGAIVPSSGPKGAPRAV